MKKVLALALSLALIATLAISGTVAYLQDTDEAVNVMTLGNVDIEQIEQERNTEGELVDFNQGKPAFPAVGPVEWAESGLDVNGTEYKVFTEELKNVVDKIVTVENTGKSDAYVRTIVAIEAPDFDPNDLIHFNYNTTGLKISAPITAVINNVEYVCFVFTYDEALEPKQISAPSMMQLFLDSKVENEYVAKFGETWEVLVVSQAVQTQGFGDAKTALDTAFGEANEANVVEWFSGMSYPVLVSSAEELAAAIAEGGNIWLTKDVEVDADATMTVAPGKTVNLNLGNHKLSGVAEGTGNREMFLVKGTMNVSNGSIEMTATQKQEWNAMATIFDVTAGGVLNIDNAELKVGGTEMSFCVHLNNWGEVTANITNSVLESNYVAVRAFNSGHDMNNITIENCEFKTGRMFWVHNYTAEGKDDSTLNLNIYGNGNTSDNAKPIRFGFDNEVYFDINGNAIA